MVASPAIMMPSEPKLAKTTHGVEHDQPRARIERVGGSFESST
jgi:hypothetical protein